MEGIKNCLLKRQIVWIILLLYAATKSNELIAHTYSHLFNLPSIDYGFTVYGRGRPDMVLLNSLNQLKINLLRFLITVIWLEFTYIDDVVESLFLLINKTNNYSEIKKNENFDKMRIIKYLM